MRPIAEFLPSSAAPFAWRHASRLVGALALLAAPLACLGQSSPIEGKAPELLEAGIPAFVVLGPEALGMATAPVDLKQLPDGRMLAVGHGELALGDGVRWDVFRQRDGEPRVDTDGVAIDAMGRIYAGIPGGIARIEFGQDGHWFFQRQENNPAELSPDSPPLIHTATVGDEWFWWWGSGPVVAWHPGNPARLVGRINAIENVFLLGQEAHLSDQSNGALFRLEEGSFRPVALPSASYVDSTVTSTVALGDGRTLLGTISEGVVLLEGASLRPFNSTGLLSGEHRINDVCAAGGGLFAAALDNVGIVFFDRTGRTVQVLDRTVDHRFSRVKKLRRAPGGIVWALLNEGIARIQFPARVSNFEPLVSTGLAFSQPFRHDGRLWLMSDGRAQRGVYDPDNRLIRFVVDTPGPYLTSLVNLSGQWVATTLDGIFRHEAPNTWTLLAKGPSSPHIRHEPVAPGVWLYVAENETGWLRLTDGQFAFERIPVPGMGHAYGAIADAEGVFWAELGNAKVARITPTRPQPTVELLGREQGVPEGWAQLCNIDGTVRINSPAQVLRYDGATRRFVPDVELMRRFPALAGSIGRPASDAQGRLWVSTNDRVRVIDPKTPAATGSLEAIPDGLHPLYFTPQSDGVVWMNQRMRVARFDPSLPLPEPVPLHAQITRIEFPTSNRIIYAVGRELPPVAAGDNSLVVHFLAPDSPFGQPVAFDLKLDGAPGDWLAAGNSSSMTFNHVEPGTYLLHVRPRIGTQYGREATLAFTVLTPWYRTRMAYAGYVLGAILLLLLAGGLTLYFGRLEKARLERLVASRTRELHETNRALELQIHESLTKANALRVSEDRYRRLSDNAPDIIFRLNVAGGIGYDYVSPAVTRITGYRPQEFLADPRFAQKIAYPPGSETIFELATSGRVPPEVRELRWQTRDGGIVTIEERLTPVRDATGRLIAIEGIGRDITQSVEDQERRRRLEAQLLQSQKLESIGTLAGGIAHDFNNILTGILGYCELATLSAGDDREQQDNLRQIRAAGLRAKDLVAQILTFSRKGESKLVAVNLASVVGEALKLVRATTPATIEIQSNLTDGTVLADATQIHQIVINLCTNGIHAMRESPGRLSVSIQRAEADAKLVEELVNLPPGPGLKLTIRDTGTGMDEATLARIFDPFFTTKKPGEGSGLGLSIVQGIVAGHHGGLRVTSKMGLGTTFEIYFPLSPTAVAETRTADPAGHGHQQHILVVDDEPSVADFVAKVLGRRDYRTTVFYDSREAIAAVAAAPVPFDAIVTDMTMPHVTGLELIHEARAQGVVVPAIITSGYSQELMQVRTESLQGIVVLAKPFEGDDLVRALNKILANP